MHNPELVKLTAPSIKPSFSPNLHKFLKAWNKSMPDYYTPQVWRHKETGYLWIGRHYEDDPFDTAAFSGVMLTRVLGIGAKALQDKGCYMQHTPRAMTQLQDFWERYLEIGRCAIDAEHTWHFVRSADRFCIDGNTRICNWCGAKHLRHVEIKTYTEEIERFEPIAA